MEILTAAVPDESLTLKQVQLRLRIGPTKAYQLVSTGELPCVRVGRAIRIERQTMELSRTGHRPLFGWRFRVVFGYRSG